VGKSKISETLVLPCAGESATGSALSVLFTLPFVLLIVLCDLPLRDLYTKRIYGVVS
jgi:hypothetical protein